MGNSYLTLSVCTLNSLNPYRNSSKVYILICQTLINIASTESFLILASCLTMCVSFSARAVHQQGVCICAEPELQLGAVAYVSLPAHLCQRNTYGKKETKGKGKKGRWDEGVEWGEREEVTWGMGGGLEWTEGWICPCFHCILFHFDVTLVLQREISIFIWNTKRIIS